MWGSFSHSASCKLLGGGRPFPDGAGALPCPLRPGPAGPLSCQTPARAAAGRRGEFRLRTARTFPVRSSPSTHVRAAAGLCAAGSPAPAGSFERAISSPGPRCARQLCSDRTVGTRQRWPRLPSRGGRVDTRVTVINDASSARTHVRHLMNPNEYARHYAILQKRKLRPIQRMKPTPKMTARVTAARPSSAVHAPRRSAH